MEKVKKIYLLSFHRAENVKGESRGYSALKWVRLSERISYDDALAIAKAIAEADNYADPINITKVIISSPSADRWEVDGVLILNPMA